MEAELLLCPLDVPSTRWQTKHPPGGMAVAAAWLPVCAEDLTRRQLLIPFWTNFRISKAIAANIIIDTENTKGFEPIWVFIFTGRFSRYCRAKRWYSLSSWIHLQYMTGSIRNFFHFFYSGPLKKIVLSEVGASPKMLYLQILACHYKSNLILCKMKNLGPGGVQLQYHLGNEYKYD